MLQQHPSSADLMFQLTLQPGSIFAGRYRILRGLKAGGMGWVFVAEHISTSQRLALKLMRPEIVASPELRSRFAQEARVSAMIQSRHIVAVTDAGVDDGTPYLAMEFLVGKELGELLDDRPLPPELAGIVIAQLAKGLEKAHAAGIVHRDLKPENIFLTRDEDGHLLVKILDFGIAKLVQGVSTTTVAGGTPQYMAPEQTRKGSLTSAVDIWACGLIAHRMLSGQSFWQAETVGELYAEILRSIYPAPSTRSPVALPAGFDEFFARCVTAEPASRFSSVTEMAEAFAALVPPVDARAAAEMLVGPTPSKDPFAANSGTVSSAPLSPNLSPHRGAHSSSPYVPPPIHAGPLTPSQVTGATQLAAEASVYTPPTAFPARAGKKSSARLVVSLVLAALVLVGGAVALALVFQTSKPRRSASKTSRPSAVVTEGTSAETTPLQLSTSAAPLADAPSLPPPSASLAPIASASAPAIASVPAPLAASKPPPAQTQPPVLTPRIQQPAADPCGHCNPGPNYCRTKCAERRAQGKR